MVEKGMDPTLLKIAAATAALQFVEDGMRLGLGTGTTAEAFVGLLADRCVEGLRISGVSTSERTSALCRELGIPLTSLDETPELDLTVDGADEIDGELNLIKGGGGALLREKIVAAASREMIVIADSSKLVQELGRFPLPIEVNQFGLRATQLAIAETGKSLDLEGSIELRMAGTQTFITDGGHFILDASFGRIPDPRALSEALHDIPGVVEHGLFLGLATRVIIAGPEKTEILNAARQ